MNFTSTNHFSYVLQLKFGIVLSVYTKWRCGYVDKHTCIHIYIEREIYTHTLIYTHTHKKYTYRHTRRLHEQSCWSCRQQPDKSAFGCPAPLCSQSVFLISSCKSLIFAVMMVTLLNLKDSKIERSYSCFTGTPQSLGGHVFLGQKVLAFICEGVSGV